MIEALLYSLLEGRYVRFIYLFSIAFFAISCALHAAVYKRHARAAFAWFAFIAASPILGSIFYFYFGINRIERKASKLKIEELVASDHRQAPVDPDTAQKLTGIKVTGESLSYSPACSDTKFQCLNTGDEAYPAMLKSIGQAKKNINLFSYIFNYDPVGELFIAALAAAVKRGVEVRVLVDGVGSQKGLRSLRRTMKENNIQLSTFLPVLWRPSLANMRNHRKLLIIDGETAFTGGLNIAEIYWPNKSRFEKVLDFHFKLQGPIVYYLQAAFADDWYFARGELLQGETFFRPHFSENNQDNIARVVTDGPGNKEEKMRWHFVSAINGAQKSIRIASPYFLPDSGISTALISAAIRGIDVDILIPSKLDHPLVEWATFGSLWEMLAHNCRIWLSPPPFDHSKLFIVDGAYTSIGSSNWDPRSLRLNYELNVEVYCQKLAEELTRVFDQKKANSRLYSLQDHESRPYLRKVKHGFARMLSPYL